MSSMDESGPRAPDADVRTRPADHDRREHDAGALGGTDTPWETSHPGERRSDREHTADGPGPRERRLTEPDRGTVDDPPDGAGARARRPDDAGGGGDRPAALISHDRAADYRARWEALKAGFVDEPRTAVRGADELVGQVLDEIEEVFRRQRGELERDLHDDQASTEDLRLALGRYRSFFDRLLAF
ncbi:hypothetical protein [Pseudonocardia acidicola]|uniref:Uncharacterized protein n=1 Tax=Pseudonocardia acidicola TaxID=2724939 RepID=A0ABX1S7X4_9PSEU|nr:hypothetical protein [Pseudonocardia acidicola]NMH97656.1 hypothetical protein [Pseudonocardia acidicola]